MVARSLATTALILIVVLSAVGWYRFAAAAGGTATSDRAALAASARARIGQAIGDAPSIAVTPGTRLTSTDLASLIAAHAAAIQASRGDMTAIGAAHNAATHSRQGDVATVAHSAGAAVPVSNESLLLAILLASYRADPTGDLALRSPSWRTSVAQGAVDLAPLIDAWAQRLDQASHASMAEAAVASSTSVGLTAATIEELFLAALESEGLDGLVFETSAAQSFPALSNPSLAGAALTAVGLSRVDAGWITEQTLALLGQGVPESTALGGIATTAQGASDLFSLHDEDVALAAATYVEALMRDSGGYLLEDAASRLEATASERNTIDHLVAGMLRSIDYASLNDQNAATTAAKYPRFETIGMGSGATQLIGGLATAGDTRVGAIANQRPAFLRVESSSLGAGTMTGVMQRRSEHPRLRAEVEVRSARHPYATAAVRSVLTIRLARALMAEPLGLHAVPASSIRGPIADAQSLSETATFAVITAGPTAVAAPTPGHAMPPAVGALAPAGVVPPNGIVPPLTARSSTTQEEVLSVVWPTQPATLEARKHGVTLNVPAGARSVVFQTRVTVESLEALEVPPAGEVLRVVRIEIFDALGRPVADPSPDKPLDLVIRLGSDEIGRIDPGRADLLPGPDMIRLQRFDPGGSDAGSATGGVWLDIPLREWSGDSVSASLDHLSLFALVASPRQMAPRGNDLEGEREVSIVQGRGRTMPRVGGPLTALVVAAAVIAVGTFAAFGGRSVARLIRRKPRSEAP